MAKKQKTKETGAVVRDKNGATTTLSSSHAPPPPPSPVAGRVTSFPLHLLTNDRWKPPTDSRLQVLVPGRVMVLAEFLTVQECQSWITFCETLGRLEYTAHPASKFIAHRECYRMQQHDAKDLAQVIYERMTMTCSLLPLVHQETASLYNFKSYPSVGCNPNLRLYKYLPGHSFGKHVDGSDMVADMGKTEWTVLIYLSECQGGATRFYTESGRKRNNHHSVVAYEPKVGSILLHLHGDHCLEHEGEQVRGGIKYVLRTDLVFAQPRNTR